MRRQAAVRQPIKLYEKRDLKRMRKTNSGTDTVFHYDLGGRLIAETNPSGTLEREVIYLGDIPVAVVQ